MKWMPFSIKAEYELTRLHAILPWQVDFSNYRFRYLIGRATMIPALERNRAR
ncbi:MAG: hypothetical protein JWL90_3707 [Chthoniobacteraceae bacterium]|nr:hypothetical protein [Chthoniobacteraceae bacterium]